MNQTRITDAATEPVSSTELKEQLGVSTTFNDVKIARNIKAARQILEKDTDRSLITQTWRITLDNWPRCSVIYLPKGPTASVTTLKYIPTTGSEVTLVKDTHFTVSNKNDIATISPIGSWPDVISTRREAIEIVYVTGEATADDWAKEAVIAMATELYHIGQVKMDKVYSCLSDPHRIIFNYGIND